MANKNLLSVGLGPVFICAVLGGVMPDAAIAQTDAGGGAADAGFWSLVFTKGGLVTWVIALLSAVGLPIAAVKIYQFVQMDIWRPQALELALQNMRGGGGSDIAGDIGGDAMAHHFNKLAHPAAALIGYALAEAHSGAMAAGVLREELGRRAQFLVRHLARHIWILELIAASAPLLGLLGTVLGMIVAFQGVGQGVGGGGDTDTALLAAGIWEALLTTAFGLAVALPFSILAAIFNNAVDEVRDLIEDALTQVLVRTESLQRA